VNLLLAIFIVVLLSAVVFVVSAPLRAARRPGQEAHDAASASAPERPHADAVVERDELVAARAAKYREIRDAEMDYRTGKLSREDYQAIDGELRAEAVEILDRLEGLVEGLGEPSDPPAGEPGNPADDDAGRV
jgi:hypothetical protein